MELSAHYDSIAQLVVSPAFNPAYLGSSPSGIAGFT